MRKWVLVIWCCLLARGAFYCSAMPLWEGFDEWAHFGVIERMRLANEVIVDRNTPLSEEVYASLRLAPLPRGVTRMPPESVTHDDYWKLSEEERSRRQRELASLSSTGIYAEVPAYEASQPPLYYWITALALKNVGSTPLLTRVWIARYLTFFIGSLVVPCGFLVFKRVWKDDALAFAGTAFVAALPALSLNMARVSNESLGIVVFTLLTLALLGLTDQPHSWKWAVLSGVALGCGLLTKAYFLTAIPGGALAYVLASRTGRREAWRIVLTRVAIMLSTALLIGGWWYLRNLRETGTISGLDEALALRDTSILEKLVGAFHLNWIKAVATVVLSHIWYGGWSLLSLPRWLDYIGFAVILVAVAGLFRAWKPAHGGQQRAVTTLLSLYAFFWLGQAYQILELFLSKDSSTALHGWYLYALIAAESVLLYAGLAGLSPPTRRWIFPTLTLMACLLEFFALHTIWLPYFAQGEVALWITRLSVNKPAFLTPATLSLCWIAFVISSMTIIMASMLRARSTESHPVLSRAMSQNKSW